MNTRGVIAAGLLLIVACTSMSTITATSIQQFLDPWSRQIGGSGANVKYSVENPFHIPTEGGAPSKWNPFIKASPPGWVGEAETCWSAIESIQGCVQQIVQFLGNNQVPSTLGSSCCKAISELDNNCWTMMFPASASFVKFQDILKDTCVKFAGNADAPANMP